MDLDRILQDLHLELKHLDAAIASLERLQESSRNRDRPADWLEAVAKRAPRRKRRNTTRKPDGDPS